MQLMNKWLLIYTFEWAREWKRNVETSDNALWKFPSESYNYDSLKFLKWFFDKEKQLGLKSYNFPKVWT